MTPIEILALIIALLSAIKIVIGIVNPGSWMAHVVVPIWKNPFLVSLVALILGFFSLNYLLAEISIVQIFAVLFFLMCIMALTFVPYSKDIVAFGGKMIKDRNFLKKEGLVLLIWIVLIVWVLSDLIK